MGYNQGKFKPHHPEKYIGDPTNIIFRSGWECKFMIDLDNNPDVISWSSEELAIPYISPVDNRQHRYFVDFCVKTKKGTFLIEIKPARECKPPTATKNRKRLLKESRTYAVNQAKWHFANQFCDKHGWKFKVLTEKELFGV